jgi:hypothetical protein
MDGKHVLTDLDEVFRSMLPEITDRAPFAPGYTVKVLEFCMFHILPGTYDIFLEEITQISDKEQKMKAKWGDLICLKMVQAALRQVPVNPHSRCVWEKLLEKENYSSIALSALSQTNHDLLLYLPRWWAALSPDSLYRRNDLKNIFLCTLIRAFEHEPHLMRHEGATWPRELREEINSCFGDRGYEEPFRK